ncbi:hypothetical protein ACLB2K_037471 [Fragaria x ananassa]
MPKWNLILGGSSGMGSLRIRPCFPSAFVILSRADETLEARKRPSREVAEKATKEIGSLFMGKKRKMRGSRTEQENYSRKWERPNREEEEEEEEGRVQKRMGSV